MLRRLAVALATYLLLFALGPTAGIALGSPGSAVAITSAQCDSQVNDTPSKLLPCIQQDDLWNHMKAFQAIADANPGPDGHASRRGCLFHEGLGPKNCNPPPKVAVRFR
jgi:hypothetical protein